MDGHVDPIDAFAKAAAAAVSAGAQNTAAAASATPPPSPPPAVDPLAQPALNALLSILNGKNDCSTFFDNGTPGSAAKILSSTTVKVSDRDPRTEKGSSWKAGTTALAPQGGGANSTIWVNKNGAFFNAKGIIDFKVENLSVADGFTGGTLGTQVLALAHETSHLVGIAKPDANNDPQGKANTQQILDHCKTQIEALPH